MAINAPCQQILAFKVSVFTTVIVFIANVSTHMSWWMMIATNHLQPQAMILFQFCYKLMVGLWAALEQEPTKQEFLSVPTHLCSGVFIQYTLVNIHQCTSGVYSYIIQCTRVVGMVGLPPPAEVVVTALHWALYQTLAPNFVPLHWLHCNTALVTLHCLHCICNILSEVHNMLSILLTDPNHTSYLSFHLHRHSVRLKYITPKTCYLWQNWIRVKRAQIGQTLCVRSYTAVKSLYIV